MKITRFSTGGGVAHKVFLLAWPRRLFSAWFAADGVVIDAESRDIDTPGGKTRPATLRQREALQGEVDTMLALLEIEERSGGC